MPVAGGGSDAVVSAASRQPGNRVVHAVSYKYMMMGLSPASAVAITPHVQPPLAGPPVPIYLRPTHDAPRSDSKSVNWSIWKNIILEASVDQQRCALAE